eukprot:SM000045S16179  [mRNA]  locus=s45:109432:111698:+ [translate_table: standard]
MGLVVGPLTAAPPLARSLAQERLVYVPVVPGLTKAYPFTPARARLQYEDVWLTARDGVRLHAWFLKLQPANAGELPVGAHPVLSLWAAAYLQLCGRPTIVFFQENAGSIPPLASPLPPAAPRLPAWRPLFTEPASLCTDHSFAVDARGSSMLSGFRLDFIAMMMLKLQCNVFMLSYRGLPGPYLPEHCNVAQASLDHLLARPDIDSKQIVLFGRSLGGAVATQLTANNPGKVAAIVLENTFTSVLDMAGQMLPFLGYLVGTEGVKLLNPLVRSPWRTVDIIASVHTPVLFLAGLQDEMVPPAQMRRLFEQCKADPRNAAVFVEFRTGAHMDTWVKGGERYWRVLELFLRQHVMEQKQPHGAAANGARSELSDELSGQRHAVL